MSTCRLAAVALATALAACHGYVTQGQDDPAAPGSTLTATPAAVVADGVAAATLTVTVVAPDGRPAPDQAVAIVVGGSDNLLSAAAGRTAATGTWTATLRSTRAEAKALTVTLAALTLTGTVRFVAGPAAAANSSLTAVPERLAGDGSAASSLVVTLRDAQGNPVTGQAVHLAAPGAGAMLSAAEPVTDAAGRAASSLAAAAAGRQVVTATFADQSLATAVVFAGRPCAGPRDLGMLPAVVSANAPRGAALADMDGDGMTDLVLAAAQYGPTVGVCRGTGHGTFAPPAGVNPAAFADADAVRVHDVDRDGHPDVLVAANAASLVAVLPNDGTGALGTPTTYPLPHGATQLQLADVNGDGYLDVVVNGDADARVSVLLGSATGAFTAAAGIALGSGGIAAFTAVGDVDRDGRPDLLTLDPNAAALSLARGVGDGTFGAASATPTLMAPGAAFAAMVAADLDADGDLDVAIVQPQAAVLVVLRGNGAGGFGAPQPTALAGGAANIVAADMTGDGRPDLVLSSVAPQSEIRVLPGVGDGTFAAALAYSTSLGGPGVGLGTAVGHIDADGRLDLVSLSTSTWLTTVYLGGGAALRAPTALPTAAGHAWLATAADFNGDGYPDVAMSTEIDAAVLALSDGQGGLGAFVPLDGGTPSWGIAAGDLDRDGSQDLVLSGAAGDSTLRVLHGDGHGGFVTAPLYGLAGGASQLTLADLDGDGVLDLVAPLHTGVDAISVSLGQGDGSFGPGHLYGGEPSLQAAVVQDLDGDGRPDVMLVGPGSPEVSVRMGTGGGALGAATAVAFAAAGGAEMLVGGDIDGDGRPDLAVPSLADRTVVLLIGRGDGTFAPPRASAYFNGAAGLALGDLNNDGRLDIAGVARDDATVVTALQQPDGSFVRTEYPTHHTYPYHVLVADLDADGWLDLGVTSGEPPSLTVLRGAGCL